jgi:DNA-binding CsgD family transcriptional regulator
LIRAAVYGAASGVERRRIHATLAELIGPSEQDRRAWHLAAAAEGPDESTASELVSAAERAQRRGGWAARFAFLARAAELTPRGRRQSDRLLVAAEAALVAGLPAEAEGLVDRAKKTVSDPLRIAQARRLEAALLSFNKPGRAPAILLEAAESLQDLDPEAARDTYIEALQACLVSCQLTFGTTPAAVGTAALAVPRSPSSAGGMSDAILTGFATRFSVGYRKAAPSLRLVVDELSGSATMPAGLTRWAILGNNAAADLWDAEGYRKMLANLEQSERRRGALDSLRITLGGMGHCLMWAGDFGGADVAHSEATQISVALGEEAANWEALKVELFAWQGQDEETRFVAEILMGEFTESVGGGVAVNLARIALVILNLAQGNYEEALTHALKLMADDPCPHGSQVLPEVVEAAVRSGNDASAATAIALLRDRATTSGTAWALGLLARSEALATADDPEAKYREAIDLLQQTYVKTDLARTHLLYGEWLRRQKRRGDARDHLRLAFDLFGSMGAKAFAERARLELLATGERARRHKESNPWQLTPQERQIASLAAGGDTNQEIAEKLFLSASTVDYHLRKVYRKLSITSRRKLATALDRGPDAALESQGV